MQPHWEIDGLETMGIDALDQQILLPMHELNERKIDW